MIIIDHRNRVISIDKQVFTNKYHPDGDLCDIPDWVRITIFIILYLIFLILLLSNLLFSPYNLVFVIIVLLVCKQVIRRFVKMVKDYYCPSSDINKRLCYKTVIFCLTDGNESELLFLNVPQLISKDLTSSFQFVWFLFYVTILFVIVGFPEYGFVNFIAFLFMFSMTLM